MKGVAIAFCAALLGCVGMCREMVDVAVGESFDVSIWGADDNVTFRVLNAVANETVNVRVIRRKPFYFSTSRMFLCSEDLGDDCTNTSLWSYEYDSNGTSVIFTLFREPHTYDTETPITIKVCNETCEPECPDDCAGAGGCNVHYHTCFCDTGYSISEGSCVGETLTDGRVALIVCLCLLAVIIILVVVGILFHFCENKAPKGAKPKST